MQSRQLSSPALEERSYYVASRRPRRRRAHRLALPLLLAAVLFGGGFLLGRAAAAAEAAPSLAEDSPAASAEGGTVAPVAVLNAGGAAALQNGADDSSPATAEDLPAVPQPVMPAAMPDAGGAAALQSGTNAPPPAADVPSPEEDWNLRLVNGDNPLPKEFAVPELTVLKNGHSVDSRAYPALQEMMDAARAAGLQPVICSSFRTWDKQSALYARKVAFYLGQGLSQAEAEAEAAVWVARPGTSEHQVGLAVDIVDLNYQLLDEGQENTAVQQWLMAHCWEYGFILRYPTDKSDLTGVGYEPWHYRYVGKTAAQAMTAQGLCLEEYLEQAG